MTLQTLVCAITEGLANDARGMPTLVGVEPQLWSVPSSEDVTIAPFLVVIAEDVGEPATLVPGTKIDVQIQASDPLGETIFFTRQQLPVQELEDPGLPHRLQFMAQLPLTVGVPGMYTAELQLSVSGETHRWSRPIRIART